MSVEQERALDILLRAFESQMNDLEAQAVSGWFPFPFASAKLIGPRRRQASCDPLPSVHAGLPLL